MKGPTPRPLFWAGWGLTAFFFQLPLTKMVLSDAQTLFLGSWDWAGFALFCAATYLLIPALASLALAGTGRLSRRGAELLLGLAAGYLLAVQVRYFLLARAWGYSDMTNRASWAIFLASFLAAALAPRFLVEFFRTCAVLGLGTFLLFAYRASPATMPRPWAPGPAAAAAGAGGPPVFFLTFEKLVSRYFTSPDGRLLAEDFPNLARLVSGSDYYPNSYANSNATVFALQSLYTGREVRAPWGFSSQGHLRAVLGRRGKTVMLLDLLDYCDPMTDVCVRTVGASGRSRLDLVAGWYKTYLRTAIPEVPGRTRGLLAWSFDPWTDMWGREAAQADAGPKLPVRAGERQFRLLTGIVEKEGAAPNLYVMHNWISDDPEILASSYREGPQPDHEAELRKTRKRLAAFDRELGRFVSFLKEKGLYDRALIFLAADTGYDPGIDEARPEETLPAAPEALKILTLIKRPGQTRGRVIPAVLRQVDVLPTILKDLGVDPAPYAFDGAPVVDPQDKTRFSERPLAFFLSSKAGSHLYRLDQPGGPLWRRLPSF